MAHIFLILIQSLIFCLIGNSVIRAQAPPQMGLNDSDKDLLKSFLLTEGIDLTKGNPSSTKIDTLIFKYLPKLSSSGIDPVQLIPLLKNFAEGNTNGDQIPTNINIPALVELLQKNSQTNIETPEPTGTESPVSEDSTSPSTKPAVTQPTTTKPEANKTRGLHQAISNTLAVLALLGGIGCYVLYQ